MPKFGIPIEIRSLMSAGIGCTETLNFFFLLPFLFSRHPLFLSRFLSCLLLCVSGNLSGSSRVFEILLILLSLSSPNTGPCYLQLCCARGTVSATRRPRCSKCAGGSRWLTQTVLKTTIGETRTHSPPFRNRVYRTNLAVYVIGGNAYNGGTLAKDQPRPEGLGYLST